MTIDRLVLFGATGDLAARYLLPALAALHAVNRLPHTFRVIGAGREPWDDETFRQVAAEALEQYASDVPTAAREALLRSMRYRSVDLNEPASVSSVLASGQGAVAAYLALPPSAFPPAVRSLAAAGMPPGSRIVVEKPFGTDLESATALNRSLARVAVTSGEQGVFRVDHVLGMSTVQNLAALRFVNGVPEAFWSSAHIEQVEIHWEETLALEGRAGYYDATGALKDVMQNHMLQLLSLIAMEPPATVTERDLRDRKVEALRSIRPPSEEEMSLRTRRGRYTAGRLPSPGGDGEREVPAYVDEDGVDPQRRTETFAEAVFELDTERWRGTRFVLRAGKALRERRKMVVLRFHAGSPIAAADGPISAPQNELHIGIDGPEEVALHLNGGTPTSPAPLVLTAPPPGGGLPPYGHVLLDVLEGGSALSVRGDEAELAWRTVAPILDAWDAERVPLEEYPAGSPGPSGRGTHS